MTTTFVPPAANASVPGAPSTSLQRWLAELSGAPLDFIKTAAAFFMVLDHTNTILYARAYVWLFRFGRIAFPLFCFAVAFHVMRDREHRGRSLGIILVFAVVTQPIYAWAFQSNGGNVLFTLAAGIAVATFLAALGPLLRHALLALAFVVSWWVPTYAITVSDYGLLGMVFPAAIALTAIGGWSYLPWVIVYGASVNVFPQVGPSDVSDMLAGHPDIGRWFEPAVDAVFAVGGSAAVIAASAWLIGWKRFLPRYALHVFYPGHIGLIAVLRTVVPIVASNPDDLASSAPTRFAVEAHRPAAAPQTDIVTSPLSRG